MSFFKNKENLLVLCIIAFVLFLSLGRERSLAAPTPLTSAPPAEEAVTEAFVYVHLTGQIKNPGVIRVARGARLQDAVAEAGGLFPDADTTRINLSMKLEDEDKIHIPGRGEEDTPLMAAGGGGAATKININQADQNELEQLPGIGPALAGRIIEYREDQAFASIEEIRNVRGIGDKLFEGMKDQITVR